MVINAAGLWAPEVARSLAGFPADRIPASHHAKGNYYALAGRSPFSRLVYPLPETGGLGVHLTLDLGGQARFGPTSSGCPTPRRGGQSVPSITASTRRAPAFAPRSAATGQGCLTRRWRRPTPASGRKSPAARSRPPTS
jgi:L-2-hydroxyglutarate oxidase LhgO